MRKEWTNIAALALIIAIAGGVIVGAQTSQANKDTYIWSGEFVGLDATAKTMTMPFSKRPSKY